jgi:hypothetical protein
MMFKMLLRNVELIFARDQGKIDPDWDFHSEIPNMYYRGAFPSVLKKTFHIVPYKSLSKRIKALFWF